jgi:GDP-L-fucose synthase
VVLVTGAGGMLGRAVEAEVVRLAGGRTARGGAPLTHGCGLAARGGAPAPGDDGTATEWVFTRRTDGDLADAVAVEALFRRHQPTHVLHLAARLQSLNEMTARPVEFWLDNVAVNNNVLAAAHKFRGWCGPIRVVSVLSTVMFPRDAAYPVGPAAAEEGTLHPAGEAYGLAKRALAALSRWYAAQHGDDFVTVLPGNFFGAHGDFGASTAPLVNALIAKATAAAAVAGAGAEAGAGGPAASPPPPPVLHVMGTGKPLRQLMHARDLARALLWALEHYAGGPPLIVAGPEHSIREVAEMVASATGFAGELTFDTGAVDGPLRRTADASAFAAACPDFAFTPLADGIKETAEWYRAARG